MKYRLSLLLTDGVDAHDLEALELGDGLELRPGHLDVDALPQAGGHAQAGGRLAAGRPQRGRVHVVGGEVAGPEPAQWLCFHNAQSKDV